MPFSSTHNFSKKLVLTTNIGISKLNPWSYIEIQLKLCYLQIYRRLMGVRNHVPLGHETLK